MCRKEGKRSVMNRGYHWIVLSGYNNVSCYDCGAEFSREDVIKRDLGSKTLD